MTATPIFDNPITEKTVLEEEKIRRILRRRILVPLFRTDPTKTRRKPYVDESPSALCFSGGGIRSASFCLGVARALAKNGVLKNFDYMSTVSGGGFTGAFLTRWAHERGYEEVEKILENDSAFSGNTDALYPLLHLRRYIAYLTPKLGLLSLDSLAVGTLYFRNTFLHWMVIVPWLLLLCLLPQLLDNALHFSQLGALPYQTVFLALAAALFGYVYSVYSQAREDSSVEDPSFKKFFIKFVVPSFAILLSVTMMIGDNGILKTVASFAANSDPSTVTTYCNNGAHSLCGRLITLTGSFQFVGTLLLIILLAFLVWHIQKQTQLQKASRSESTQSNETSTDWLFLINFLILCMQIFVGLFILSIGGLFLSLFQQPFAIQAAIVLLPALLQLSYLASDAIYNAGHSRQQWTDMNQEWTGRISGSLITLPLLWGVVSAISLWAPPSVIRLTTIDGGGLNPILTFGGATTVIGAGGYALSQLTEMIGKTKNNYESWKAMGLQLGLWVVLILFSISLLTLLSLLGWEITNKLRIDLFGSFGTFQNAIANMYLQSFYACIILMAVSLSISYIVDLRTNLNRFSLHHMYRNRLIRTFIGAANPARANYEPGFVNMLSSDNISLYSLNTSPKTGIVPPSYHVINMSMNIPGSRDLGFQERRAISFTASPLYVGSSALPLNNPTGCFRSAETYASQEHASSNPIDKQQFSIGGAIAISGAAFDPSMGKFGSAAMRLLFTIANIRLGAWLGNPSEYGKETYKLKGPHFIMKQLAYEFFGLANERRAFVHLSDGGHFENLAVYEMLRRRCGLILVVDAGCDQQFLFDDLGSLQRLAKVDLNAEIHVPIDQLNMLKAGTISFVKATVTYRDKTTNAEKGAGDLYYIKPSVPKDAQPEIETYRRANPSFPHQTTLNQFFTESQFLAYMALGKKQGEDLMTALTIDPPAQYKEWFK